MIFNYLSLSVRCQVTVQLRFRCAANNYQLKLLSVTKLSELGIAKRCLTENLPIHLECEDGLEKSVPRIAVWHHEACRVMTIGDPEGHIFLGHGKISDGDPRSAMCENACACRKNVQEATVSSFFFFQIYPCMPSTMFTALITTEQTCARYAFVPYKMTTSKYTRIIFT